MNSTPAPTRVALLDTAVDQSVVRTVCRVSTDRRGNLLELPRDGEADRHGSRIGALINCAAPDADLYSVEVLSGGDNVARIVTGLRWAASIRPHLVCLALGIDAENVVLGGLVEELSAAGSLVVAAIGNDGAGEARQPAMHPSVLAVGACGDDGRVLPESGSRRRPMDGAVKPDILATSVNGTSAACGRVVGEAAAVWARHPCATAVEVRAALVDTARPVADGQAHRSAHGKIDPAAADEQLGSSTLGRMQNPFIPERSSEPWVDPRLWSRLARLSTDEPVRAVLRRETTEVVEMSVGELRRALTDPSLRAASAPDVRALKLAGR